MQGKSEVESHAGRRLRRARTEMLCRAGVATLACLWQHTGASAQQAMPPVTTASSDAAGAAVEPGEIVVTAQRREQRVQDVPASLTALSGGMLEKRQITSIVQLVSAVPNMQAAQAYGAGDPPSFSIRGISTTDISQSQSRPVAVYIDEGIRQLPIFEAMPLFDVDHVEVLRGPQGALYGKNATGGAISIITKQPTFDFQGYLSAGYGKFDRRESQGAVQMPLVSDTLALRVAYTYVKDDGATKQISPNPALDGRDLDQTDTFGVRATLRYRPTSDLDIVLRYNHYQLLGRSAGIYAGNRINFAAVGLPIFDTFPGAHREGLGFFENSNDFIGHRNIRNDGFNGQIKWSITPEISLLSLTTYDKGKWLLTLDADGLPLATLGNQTINAKSANQFVQELRLSGHGGPFVWLLGGFFSHDSVDIFQNFPYYAEPRCGAFCNFGLGGGGIGLIQENQFNQKRDSYSGYGRLEYAAGDWSFAGGLRWSNDKVGVNNYTATLGDTGTPRLITTIPSTTQSRSYSNVSGEATITYHPTRDFLAYASFKQGYRTGAFNAQAVSAPNELTVVPPEKANSWEAGIKSALLDRRVTFNLTGFYTRYINQQVLSAQAAGGLILLPLRSIPRARIYGGEADVTLRPTDDFTLNLAGGYANGIYKRGVVAGQSVVGKRMAGSSKWSGSVSADWKILKFDQSSVTLHVDAASQSKIYFNVLNSPGVSDGGHTVANAQLSYDYDKWTASLWVTNVFNKHYFVEVLNSTGLGHDYKVRGVPRMFGVRLRREF